MVNKIKVDKGMTYDTFRPKIVIDEIAAWVSNKQDDGYIYKGVACNYKHLPYNVEEHEKNGYSIVYDTKPMRDDRKFTPDNSQSETTVPAPVMKTSADGIKYILMRISKEDFKALKEKSASEFENTYRKSVRSISQTGNTIKVDGGEIK